jgi:hypothetical protein
VRNIRMPEVPKAERRYPNQLSNRPDSANIRAVLKIALRVIARLPVALAAPLCVWLIISGSSGSAQKTTYKWSYDKTKDGIALYTADAPRHSYDAVEAVVTLDERPETLVSILRDIPAYPSWYARCAQTRVLERPAKNLSMRFAPTGKFLPSGNSESYTLYFVQDVPVVADRWATIRNKVRFGRDGSLVIEFNSLDQYRYQAPAGAVRMRIFGFWMLTPISTTRTRVAFMIDADPEVSVPDFLVDPVLHDIAIDTLAGLRKMARSRR